MDLGFVHPNAPADHNVSVFPPRTSANVDGQTHPPTSFFFSSSAITNFLRLQSVVSVIYTLSTTGNNVAIKII